MSQGYDRSFPNVQALAADWIYVQYPAFFAQFHPFPDRQAGKCRSTDTPPVHHKARNRNLQHTHKSSGAQPLLPTLVSFPCCMGDGQHQRKVSTPRICLCTERGMPGSGISLWLFAFVLPFCLQIIWKKSPHTTSLTLWIETLA